jgi:hypothetical protein
MSADHTEYQSTDEQRRAQQLSMQRNAPPADVPGYEIKRFLGSGAYGEVWVGVDQNTGRRVAIKFYTHRGGVDWSLLSREVEKLVFLSADRYVVQLLDVGWDADPPYYVMDYIENGSLEDLLRDHGPRPLPEAVELFHEVAVGLMHLHGKGVLHCDLKPANVLLDQDHKPRLADFGQSRLSHEQSPALGTLFYMAPEQADMEAVPDARWDVYALGALLYCMLTGEPPYRNQDTLSEIDTAAGLEERLVRYRTAINGSKLPVGHRKVPGIDKPLGEIVDRCLAPNPKDRFASVQSVLEAMLTREEIRARQPLMVLGLVGPMLLLAIMLVLGWIAYSRVMNTAVSAVTERTQQSNQFAAKFASRGVAAEIAQYFDAVEKIAQDEAFRERFRQALDDTRAQRESLKYLTAACVPDTLPELKADFSQQLGDNGKGGALRTGFPEQPALTSLQDYTYGLLPATADKSNAAEESPQTKKLLLECAKLPAASWFVCDRYGTHIASTFPDQPPSATVGKNYRWRTYFSGESHDQVKREDNDQFVYGNPFPPADIDGQPGLIRHITETHLSAVFESTATGTWKVGISAPVLDDDGTFLGIVALTVEVGNFIRNEQFEGTQEQFAVLVDGREGRTRGVILQHPLYDTLLAQQAKLDDRFSEDDRYRVALDKLNDEPRGELEIYDDPLGRDELGADYAKPWVAAKANVILPNRKTDTGLVVLVQESHAQAAEPIYQLGRVLAIGGLGTLLLLVGISLSLWFFVKRGFRRPAPTSARAIAGHASSTATPLHKMETLTAAPRENVD